MVFKTLISAFYLLINIQVSSTAEVRYDWKHIPYQKANFLDSLYFEPSFAFGISDSAFQTEGIRGPIIRKKDGAVDPTCHPDIASGISDCATSNNWQEISRNPLSHIEGKKREYGKRPQNSTHWIHKNQEIGTSCNRWDTYPQDIALMAESGFTMYRTSVEWSKIEPERGVFNEEALNHYEDVCKEALKNGLEPMITLFHHTWPSWFAKLGNIRDGYGFENEKNLVYFLEYCAKVFEKLRPYVKKWIIFNEPSGYAIQGWWRGQYPPGNHDLTLAGKVLYNMLTAHIQAYKQFKSIDSDTEIGIAHIMQPIDPYHPWNIIEVATCKITDALLNESVLEFFTSGNFSWGLVKKTLKKQNPEAPSCLDFVGVNYYGQTVLSTQWNFKKFIAPTIRADQKESDDHKIIYPEGLYRCIKRAAQLGKPLYILENGVADSHETIRQDYIHQHLYVTSICAQEFDVRGYFYWTFIDCFEWRKGYSQQYGLYSFNTQTLERKLKPSSESFITFLKKRNEKNK